LWGMCIEDMGLERTDEAIVQGWGCKEGENICEANSGAGEVGIYFDRGLDGLFEHLQLFKVTLTVPFRGVSRRHIVVCKVRYGEFLY